jgi:hypothetical protein
MGIMDCTPGVVGGVVVLPSELQLVRYQVVCSGMLLTDTATAYYGAIAYYGARQ